MTPSHSHPIPIKKIDNEYSMHCLSESDVIQWASFCASCFSYKSNPPPASYFARHFHNDPLRDASLIHVIKHKDHHSNIVEIVASTRVFFRFISCGNGSHVLAGGIGEVCTAEFHRKKGLAKALLQKAVHSMYNYTPKAEISSKSRMQCSLLHASPSLTNVYEKSANYESVVSHWSVLPLKVSELMKNDVGNKTNVFVRLASFPKDTPALKRIHKELSEDRFAGCIVRSEDYWNEYLSKEIGDSLFVLVFDKNDESINYNVNDSKSGEILGWISVRQRSGLRVQVRDYGICKDSLRKHDFDAVLAFRTLLKRALHQLIEKRDREDGTDIHARELALPTFVLQEMYEQDLSRDCDWIDWEKKVREEDDPGWMYKILSEGGDAKSAYDMVSIVQQDGIPHLIWPSDSF